MTPILRVENVSYAYPSSGERPPVQALRGVNLAVEPGEYVVVIGHNGSGKSTLARHLNGLLLPGAGSVWVKEWDTRDKARLRDIRTTVGMVFQQPDNQIVATIVEEDIAFGPENLGLPYGEIVRRVDWALDQVQMEPYRLRAPHLLSGGQKQRVCIAGVLAMHPEVLVLDEATAMLDPQGRREVLDVARRLNREQGVTVVAITHFMREALDADRIVVMAEGEIVLEGTPRAVFAQADRLRALRLDVPPVTQLAHALHERVPDFPADLLTAEEVAAALRARIDGARPPSAPELGAQLYPEPLPAPPPASQTEPHTEPPIAPHTEPLVDVERLTHFYMRGTPLEVQALFDIRLRVLPGEIVGIIGHTGSGKSTAIQHLNGLLRPHGGRVRILGRDLNDPQTNLRALRQRVGLVFQFPEAQLFEQYVGDDVAFGPFQLGLPVDAVRERVRRAMQAMDLDFAEFKDRMTLALSGGQRRRVALAGVLALEPELLVLDEPTAGLDPQSRRQLLDTLLRLHAQGTTLVIVSHNMEELAEICDRLYVIAHGRTVREGTPGTLFAHAARLRELGLDVPDITALAEVLEQEGLLRPGTVYRLEQAVAALLGLLTGAPEGEKPQGEGPRGEGPRGEGVPS